VAHKDQPEPFEQPGTPTSPEIPEPVVVEPVQIEPIIIEPVVIEPQQVVPGVFEVAPENVIDIDPNTLLTGAPGDMRRVDHEHTEARAAMDIEADVEVIERACEGHCKTCGTCKGCLERARTLAQLIKPIPVTAEAVADEIPRRLRVMDNIMPFLMPEERVMVEEWHKEYYPYTQADNAGY